MNELETEANLIFKALQAGDIVGINVAQFLSSPSPEVVLEFSLIYRARKVKVLKNFNQTSIELYLWKI